MSFRNRCLLSGANGLMTLSVPVLGGRNFRGFIRDVRIDNGERWRDIHWRSICSAYNRSPWFEYYRDELGRFYDREEIFLWDWNLKLLEWVLAKLQAEVSVGFSERYVEAYEGNEMIDCRGRWMPNNYLRDIEGLPEYRQVFMDRWGFLPNLSVLDLLCAEGRQAGKLLGF